MDIQILSYNIFGLPWPYSKTNIYLILMWIYFKTSPSLDIICLQEVFSKEHQNIIKNFCKYVGVNWSPHFPNDTGHWLGSIYTKFYSGTGLCIINCKPSKYKLIDKPFLYKFKKKSGFDSFVTKGVFGIKLENIINNKVFTILNTHLQSDFTELKSCRINYIGVREEQEYELAEICKNMKNVLVCGDFNTNNFKYFRSIDPHHNTTYPSTDEHLDHLCLPLGGSLLQIKNLGTIYYNDVHYSDHIPVLFKICLE